MASGYDIIGDIHGSADLLVQLLTRLGYTPKAGTWRHSENRQVLFLGDIIDRNPSQREALTTVRTMVDSGDALCVMGNHEFNAVSWAMRNPASGTFLREHTDKNTKQHMAFLNAFGSEDTIAHQEWITWFKTLPLWLEIDGLQLVHACWEASRMELLRRLGLNSDNTLTDNLFAQANQKDSEAWQAVETLCKGLEIDLPSTCPGFYGKDHNLRHNIRIKWWSHKNTTYRQAALLPENALNAIPDSPLPADTPLVRVTAPTFVGHYWLEPEANKIPVAELVACLDYSAGAGGPLVAYRWNGERALSERHFVLALQK
jgi:hypothetical protein